MKATKYIFIVTTLTIALTLFMFGQDTYNDMPKTDMEHHNLSDMMGEPTVDVTVEDLHMKVWLMTLEQYEDVMKGEMMKEMPEEKKLDSNREEAMGQLEMRGIKKTTSIVQEMKATTLVTDKTAKKESMTGSHHIVLDVTEASSGEGIDDASAAISIVSPSEKELSVDLTPMMNHFGGVLTLDEAGEYEFTLIVSVNDVSETTQFRYTVN
jgi:hypothetical protein